MKRLFFILSVCLLLIPSLFSCNGDSGKDYDVLTVEFDVGNQILTTDLTVDALRSYMQVSVVIDGEKTYVEDYTVRCDFTEGYCKIYVDYDIDTVETETFFANPDKLSTEGDYLFYRYGQAEELLLMRYLGSAATLTLPEKSNSYKIFDRAFDGNTALTSVDLGDSVTVIGKHAFRGCTALRRVDFGANIQSVCNGAFTECRALEYVGVDSLETWLGISFNRLTALIDNFYTTIPGTNLGGSFITGGFTTSGGGSDSTGAIIGSSSITVSTAVSLDNVESKSEHVKIIDKNGKPLQTLVEDGALYSVDENGEKTLVRYLDVSNPLYYAKSLYVDGSHIKNVVIPDKVVSVKSAAFFGSDIESVRIHGNIILIGFAAFSYCDSLTSVTVEKTTESLANNIYAPFDADAKIYSKYLGGLYLGNETNPYMIFVAPDPEATSLPTALHEQTVAIGGYAFEGVKETVNLIIPDSVTHIGTKAFYQLTPESSVTLGANVTTIGAGAFGSSNKEQSVLIVPEGVKSGWHYTDNDGRDISLNFDESDTFDQNIYNKEWFRLKNVSFVPYN